MFIENFICVYCGVCFRPLWLSPRQAIVVPVSNKYDDYAKQVTKIYLATTITTVVPLPSLLFVCL